MSSKPKSKAKSTPREATQRDAYSRKALKQTEPSPSVAWLAEMVIRIMGDSITPTPKTLNEDVFKSFSRNLEANHAIASAMSTALRIYRASHSRLADRELEQPHPVPAGLSKKDKTLGRVNFSKGCRIITGDDKRERAEPKYVRWRQQEMLKRDDFDEMREVEEGFAVANLGRLKAAYEKNMKKPLAHDSGQEAPKTGQKPAKNRAAAGKRKNLPPKKNRKSRTNAS